MNESGLYQLVIKSKMPLAKKFQKWLFEDVIPSIRKTGGYNINNECYFDENSIDNLQRKNVNYIGYVGTHDGKEIYKYGYSDDIEKRERQHIKDFGKFITKHVVLSDNNKKVEREFETHLKRHQLHTTMKINDKNQTELFYTTYEHNFNKLVDKMNSIANKNNSNKLTENKELHNNNNTNNNNTNNDNTNHDNKQGMMEMVYKMLKEELLTQEIAASLLEKIINR